MKIVLTSIPSSMMVEPLPLSIQILFLRLEKLQNVRDGQKLMYVGLPVAHILLLSMAKELPYGAVKSSDRCKSSVILVFNSLISLHVKSTLSHSPHKLTSVVKSLSQSSFGMLALESKGVLLMPNALQFGQFLSGQMMTDTLLELVKIVLVSMKLLPSVCWIIKVLR